MATVNILRIKRGSAVFLGIGCSTSPESLVLAAKPDQGWGGTPDGEEALHCHIYTVMAAEPLSWRLCPSQQVVDTIVGAEKLMSALCAFQVVYPGDQMPTSS